jgi:hypothetical protein
LSPETETSPLEWAVAFVGDVEEDRDLAHLLEECSLEMWEEPDWSLEMLDSYLPHWYPLRFVRLTVPGDLYATAAQKENTIGWALHEALDGNFSTWYLESGPRRNWSNQGIDAPYTWQGMRFRSKVERRVARALERANAAFFPNPRGRLGVAPDFRDSREPDFIVLCEGKLGILEVDGDDFHPPERASADHARDRLFRSHGIRVVERFNATDCWEDPDRTVAEFLQLLRLNG